MEAIVRSKCTPARDEWERLTHAVLLSQLPALQLWTNIQPLISDRVKVSMRNVYINLAELVSTWQCAGQHNV